jgi:hypothetical protein
MSRRARSERSAPGGGGGTNFDPLVSLDQTERTLSVNTQGNPQRSLLSFVEGVAQAALKARNEFLVRSFPKRVSQCTVVTRPVRSRR